MVAPLATLFANLPRLTIFITEVTAALNELSRRGLTNVSQKDLMDALKAVQYWSSSVANSFGKICEELLI
ncbi:hypothetical protein H8356DRAFT_1060736 [Neocallimastix lanati (nom. inval.)]|nr:hypothetical protein H8356DRAFT_1060736 [Neocallimastix sp. JGI-2020a]